MYFTTFCQKFPHLSSMHISSIDTPILLTIFNQTPQMSSLNLFCLSKHQHCHQLYLANCPGDLSVIHFAFKLHLCDNILLLPASQFHTFLISWWIVVHFEFFLHFKLLFHAGMPGLYFSNGKLHMGTNICSTGHIYKIASCFFWSYTITYINIQHLNMYLKTKIHKKSVTKNHFLGMVQFGPKLFRSKAYLAQTFSNRAYPVYASSKILF